MSLGKAERKPRGASVDTAFRQWWEKTGRLLCGRIAGKWDRQPIARERKLMEFGFRWGWIERQQRDAKAKRAKR